MTTANGFTLIETLIVVLLMGIAATLAITAFGILSRETTLDSAAARVIGDMRYAQSLAIQTQQAHSLAFDKLTEAYRLYDQSWAVVQHPLTRQNYHVTLTAVAQFQGIDLMEALFGASNIVTFNALGAPQSAGTVTLSYAGRQRVISVTYLTGRVTVQ